MNDTFLNEYLLESEQNLLDEHFSFDQIHESKYPFLAKLGTGLLVIRLRNLQRKIEKEKNLERKIDLLGKQNSIIGYLATIGIVVDTKDKSLASKIPRFR